MYILTYARPIKFIRLCLFMFSALICAVVCMCMAGCAVKYDYCTIDLQAFAKDYQSNTLPQVQEFNISKQTLSDVDNLPQYITLQDDIIYIDCPTVTNFIIHNITNYTFIFTTDAIVTITENFRNLESAGIISTANNLYLILHGNMYSGNSSLTYWQDDTEQSFTGAIKANNLIVYSDTGAIYSGTGVCLQADTITFAGGNMLLNSDQTCIDCQDLNIHGGDITITAQTAINCQNLTSLGGKVTINAQICAINCIFLRIFNGVLELSCSSTAIICKTLEKTSGYVKISAKNGICTSCATISGGLLFADCALTCIQISDYLLITDGTNLLVSSNANTAAIEADGLQFNVTGGITIQNSEYVTKPTGGKYYGFGATSGQLIYLQCAKANYAYIAQCSGSVCISGNISPINYSTNGRLNNFEDCFYGLLFNASINAYSLINIPNDNSTDFGANWCNAGTINTNFGQLF